MTLYKTISTSVKDYLRSFRERKDPIYKKAFDLPVNKGIVGKGFTASSDAYKDLQIASLEKVLNYLFTPYAEDIYSELSGRPADYEREVDDDDSKSKPGLNSISEKNEFYQTYSPWEENRSLRPLEIMQKNISDLVKAPLLSKEAIQDRQVLIEELYSNEEFLNDAVRILNAMGSYEFQPVTHQHELPQIIARAECLVILESAINDNVFDSKSAFFNSILEFGSAFRNDVKYQDLKSFAEYAMIPYNLSREFEAVLNHLDHSSMSYVKDVRDFFRRSNKIYEVVKKAAEEPSISGFVSKELQDINLADTLKSKIDTTNKLLSQYADTFRDNVKHPVKSMMYHLLDIFDEAIYAKIPRIKYDLNAPLAELGFCISAALLAKEWKEKGFDIVLPNILDMNERKTSVQSGANTYLVQNGFSDMVIKNDVLSSPDKNIFVIEGPNDGGKTTYLREVGQLQWLAQLGAFIPGNEGAQISIVDGIFTSFGGGDTPGQSGQYLTELQRMTDFILPKGRKGVTPYSLVLFDEFANGTDHEEAIYRTKIVLEHLSKKGATSYFTTHKHEIGEYVEQGKIAGGVNLAAEVVGSNGSFRQTHRILRDAREKSYGNVIAERLGLTEKNLNERIEGELAAGAYDVADTRMNYSEIKEEKKVN